MSVNRKAAFVYFISPTQINVQAPTDDALGPVQVQVMNNGQATEPATAQLQRFSPAFFQWDKYVVATRTDFSLVGKRGLLPGATFNPAQPGNVMILWGTGFGATNPSLAAGQVVSIDNSVATPPSITIGGVIAEYLGGALTTGNVGLYQIAVRVPTNVPSGDLPVVAAVGGFRSPDGVFVTVESDSGN